MDLLVCRLYCVIRKYMSTIRGMSGINHRDFASGERRLYREKGKLTGTVIANCCNDRRPKHSHVGLQVAPAR